MAFWTYAAWQTRYRSLAVRMNHSNCYYRCQPRYCRRRPRGYSHNQETLDGAPPSTCTTIHDLLMTCMGPRPQALLQSHILYVPFSCLYICSAVVAIISPSYTSVTSVDLGLVASSHGDYACMHSLATIYLPVSGHIYCTLLSIAFTFRIPAS